MDTRKVDHGTVTYLERIKFLQSNLLVAHSVWVNDNEVIVLLTSLCSSLHIYDLMGGLEILQILRTCFRERMYNAAVFASL